MHEPARDVVSGNHGHVNTQHRQHDREDFNLTVKMGINLAGDQRQAELHNGNRQDRALITTGLYFILYRWLENGLMAEITENIASSCPDTRRARKSLYFAGSAAAFLAAFIFRRYLSAELSLFGITTPSSILGWFAVLQNNPLLGLAQLKFFDVVNFGLVGIMFLALFAALRQGKNVLLIGGICIGFVGIVVYALSNPALSLLSLSNQYATATSGTQRSAIAAEGQALLPMLQGSGAYLGFLLIAVAGLAVSSVMLRGKIFPKVTASLGILTSAMDIAYSILVLFVPAAEGYVIGLMLIPASGAVVCIWHILVGYKLYKIGSREG
jgi:hypothetical protein